MKHASTPRLFTYAFTVAAFAVAGGGCKKPDATSQARSELQKIYDQHSAALERKDGSGTLSMYAPDLVVVNQKGKTRNLDGERKAMERAFAAPITNAHFTNQIADFRLENTEGTQATARVKQHITGTVSAAGRTGALLIDGEVRDFWVKEATGWHIKREKIISSHSTIDGKAY